MTTSPTDARVPVRQVDLLSIAGAIDKYSLGPGALVESTYGVR
ncbi:hypothetical protein [Nocardioides sp. HB32]